MPGDFTFFFFARRKRDVIRPYENSRNFDSKIHGKNRALKRLKLALKLPNFQENPGNSICGTFLPELAFLVGQLQNWKKNNTRAIAAIASDSCMSFISTKSETCLRTYKFRGR